MKSVLIASPVRQKTSILKEFLWSLDQMALTGLRVEYAFIDDHDGESTMLHQFAALRHNVTITRGERSAAYHCDENTHHWQEDLIWKVAAYKNTLLQLARERDVDFVFLVDSDLVLHPKTLIHLATLDKDIVSEVFWTKWRPDVIQLPQVWVAGQYRLYHLQPDENLSEEDVHERIVHFLAMLHNPGTYKVGGLGACTLISRKALSLGVSFAPLYNLDYGGEDRHFCIRAVALGLELFADTHYPPYHIYRESELKGLSDYKENVFHREPEPSNENSDLLVRTTPGNRSLIKHRITLAMLVRNEANRYLATVLQHASRYIDDAVVLDDASDDNTVEICKSVLHGVPLNLVSNKEPSFNNEVLLRQQLWKLVTATEPEWILILDADEIFEDQAVREIRSLTAASHVDVYSFRLYDMWDNEHYRDDQYWKAHRFYRPFMVRYIPGFDYRWKETPLHCGRFPSNITELETLRSPLRLRHLGWAKPEDRLTKYARYKQLDPEGKYGVIGQYLSILDPKPNLLVWSSERHKRILANDKADQLASRFVVRSDPKTTQLCFRLPSSWWSRPYEYELARSFCAPDDIVLDAGCGLSHPLKFYLSDNCREVHACDLDDRILSAQEILADITRDFGQSVTDSFPHRYLKRIYYSKASITDLPFEDNMFDKIYCISVFEHMLPKDITRSLTEFRRTLKKDGMIVLTFDYPYINLMHFKSVLPFLGLKFAGGATFEPPDDVLCSGTEGLYCYRALLRKL